MALNLKTRDQFVQDEVAAVQANLPGAYLFPVGSIVRALVDAHASTAMWEQALIQLVYNRERLSTSTGVDADTFVGDFGLKRLAAEPSTGNVQFASYVANTQRVINVGATVSTQDGSVSFAIVVDTTNNYYNAATNTYIIPSGDGTVGSPVSIPVQATTPGTIGNVQVNTITVINSPITGIDTVNNSTAFVDGKNQQTDAELRKYFIDYLNSLSRATKSAISFAVESVQHVIEYSLTENINYTTGLEELGYFYVVVDDGSGSPPQSLIDSVTNAVEAYRGFTIRFDVKAVTTVNANISCTANVPSAYTTDVYRTIIINAITSALQTYINLIPIGETLYYTRISQIIYNTLQDLFPADIDVINVSNVLLNSGTSNLSSNTKQSIRPGTITITVVANS